MKTINPFLLCLLIVFVILCFGNLQINAQSSLAENQNEKIPLPSEEEFKESSELVSPWRSSGCHIDAFERQPGCYVVNKNQWQSSHMLTLYNEDATVWYQFSVDRENPSYFLQNTEKKFLPLATYPVSSPSAVILRLVGESPHWYKVEVNEETEATKFVLKSDPMWKKTPWSHWLIINYRLKIENDARLLDEPNGKKIEEIENVSPSIVYFLETQGDWAKVETGVSGKKYTGWIRWRDGREILIRDYFGVLGFSGINTQDLQ